MSLRRLFPFVFLFFATSAAAAEGEAKPKEAATEVTGQAAAPGTAAVEARVEKVEKSEPKAPRIPENEFFPSFRASAALKEEVFTKEEFKEMAEGDIIVKSRPVPKGREGIHVAAAGIIEGTTEEVFSVVMDCTGQPEYTPHLVACKNTYPQGVDPEKPTHYEQYQKLEFGFGFISKSIEYVNNMYAIHPYVSAWVLKEKGDVDESIGYWRVIPLEAEKQLLVYDVYNKPSMSVPNWVQEILTKSDLPNTIEAFRDRVAEIRGKK